MRAVVLCVVLAAVAYAAFPEAPRLAESFTLEALVTVDSIQGNGLWAVDQVHGQSVEKFTFANASQPSIHIIGQYDQSTRFIISEDVCSARQLGPSMPISWSWLKFAKFVGVQTIDTVDYNCWTEETAFSMRHLAVPVAGDMSSAIYTSRNISQAFAASSVVVMTVTSFVEGAAPESAPSAVFAVPDMCPPALPQPISLAELEEMSLNAGETNSSGLLRDLYGVINKAKEICTCGCPYVWGGNGPCCYGQPSGYDCSGMTMRSYNVGGYSLPRVAADQQKAGKACSGNELPGDLFFFGKPAYHVVMNLGSGSIAECPRTGLNCRITARRAYDGGCRRIA